MANLQSDPNDALPQPATLDSNSSTRSRAAANRQHFKEIPGHLLDHAAYNGHGHAEGRQGRAGHTMPRSDANKQSARTFRKTCIPRAAARTPTTRRLPTTTGTWITRNPEIATTGQTHVPTNGSAGPPRRTIGF
jgi:hypothetical protein